MMTVEQLTCLWVLWARGWYGDSRGACHSWLSPALEVLREGWGEMQVNEFRPRDLKTLRDLLIEGKRGRNSRNYVNQQVGRIISIFRWGVEEEHVTPETYQALRSVRPLQRGRTEARENDPIHPIRREVMEATAQHLHWPVCDMVRLQYLLGCRPAELCHLKRRQIQPYQDIHEITLTEHKTSWKGKTRHIAVGPQAWDILSPHCKIRAPEQYVFSPRLAALHCGYGIRHRGDFYLVSSYRTAIHRACKRAGIPRWNPNQLRHARATDIRAQMGLDVAQAVLGHASIATTERYAEKVHAKALEAARKYG